MSLKRLYQLFPNKERLVTAFLQRRDVRWRGGLTDFVGRVEDPRERLLAVFDWLHTWFTDPDYRGCAWINCFGELGASSAAVAEEARTHKEGSAVCCVNWPPRPGTTTTSPTSCC